MHVILINIFNKDNVNRSVKSVEMIVWMQGVEAIQCAIVLKEKQDSYKLWKSLSVIVILENSGFLAWEYTTLLNSMFDIIIETEQW